MGFPKYVRIKAFAIAGGRCEWCGRDWNDGYMLYAHHKIPVNDNGKDTLENCEMLCRDCHSKRHQHLAEFHKRSGNKKLCNQNAYAARTIKKYHNLIRLNWNG